ncbi:MAG: GntR family transcriptional regulator [Gemmiger sp.]|nr:GntR family transcriptional regulator [Gemmiger sp.]
MVKLHALRVPNENARAFAYRVLANYIRELLLRPGERMSEAETATQLNISRTPVHDTFVQLSDERMLAVEPQRGTTVCLLEPENIRQLSWMEQRTTNAVLEQLYRARPTMQELEPLEQCVAAEMAALKQGNLVVMARLRAKFYRNLFALAGYLPVFRSIFRIGADSYRLFHMAEEEAFWQVVTAQHMAIVQALALHEHEAAALAVKREFALTAPLLKAMQKRYPQYFAPEQAQA